jgi:phage shock protein A
MFEEIRRALDDLLHGSVPAADRRDLLTEMRSTLVRARMAVEDLRAALATSEQRLGDERVELETVRRRKDLAETAGDAETVAIAAKYETHHAERVSILERKVAVSREELALVEQEVEEMTAKLKAANAGVGSGLRAGATTAEDPLDLGDESEGGGGGLGREFGALDRERRRAEREAQADERLAELKRRMGL